MSATPDQRWSFRLPDGILAWVLPVALVACWEIAADAGLIAARVLPSPSSVLLAFWATWRDGTLVQNVAVSGGPSSPALPWMVLPAAMVAARFRPTVVVVGLALTMVMIIAATLGVDPTATIRDPVRPIAALALLAGVVSIVWALQAAELHHRDEAILDPLTGLLNRHALIPRFTEISHQARLTHQPVCMLLCDVDAFKQVNDRHGHDRGDAVLRDVAYELRKRLRSFELAYRLGGEEFLILLPGVSHAEGQEVAERLRAAIAQAHPTGIPITISLGLAAASGEAVVYETLFKAADEALYEAKRAGRNRVAFAPVAPVAGDHQVGLDRAGGEQLATTALLTETGIRAEGACLPAAVETGMLA